VTTCLDNGSEAGLRLASTTCVGNKIGIAPFSARTAKALWAWLVERKRRVKTERLWITEEGNAFSLEGLVSWFNRLKKCANFDSLYNNKTDSLEVRE